MTVIIISLGILFSVLNYYFPIQTFENLLASFIRSIRGVSGYSDNLRGGSIENYIKKNVFTIIETFDTFKKQMETFENRITPALRMKTILF